MKIPCIDNTHKRLGCPGVSTLRTVWESRHMRTPVPMWRSGLKLAFTTRPSAHPDSTVHAHPGTRTSSPSPDASQGNPRLQPPSTWASQRPIPFRRPFRHCRAAALAPLLPPMDVHHSALRIVLAITHGHQAPAHSPRAGDRDVHAVRARLSKLLATFLRAASRAAGAIMERGPSRMRR
ncbi:hypothetical protein BC628DRAFT_939413 [Trametes gibbosa]|nr:hypothetical protein BC628DRAFT_939413 [Trametes gibbosa]